MKKALKIAGITLASLVGLVVLTVVVAGWLVLTPARLTPIVQEVADDLLSCPTHIGRVNITVFKTFPDIGLCINDVAVINAVEGAPSDTVASLHELDVAVDVKAFLGSRAIRVKRLALSDVKACLYTSADSIANYDILPVSTEEDDDSSSFDLSSLDADLQAVRISHLSASLTDETSGLRAAADDLNLSLKGSLSKGDIDAALESSLRSAFLALGGDSALHVTTSDITLKADASTKEKALKANASLTSGPVDFGVSTVTITADALGLSAKADRQGEAWHADGILLNAVQPAFALTGSTPIAIDGDQLDLALTDARLQDSRISGTPMLSVPTFSMRLNGEQWVDHRAVSLLTTAQTTTAFQTYAFDNARLTIDDVTLGLTDGHLDLTDSTGTAIAAHLMASRWDVPTVLAMLPRTIRKALPDMTVRRAALDLDIAAAIRAGSAGLAIDSADGSLALDRVDLSLGDSMAFVAPSLALTVQRAQDTGTTPFRPFLQGTLAAKAVEADLTGLGTAALTALNGTYALADFTSKLTPFSASAHLAMETLNADLDTIQGALTRPVIDALLTTDNGRRNGRPTYTAALTTDALSGHFGNVVTASTAALALDAKATYDKTAKELLDQWNPALDIDLHTAHVELGMFPEAIDVPHIQFAFTPGKCTIDESAFHLGNSDFCLKGDITNLDAWLSQTGLLTAALDFTSSYTDVSQLMTLISGLGSDTSTTGTTSTTASRTATLSTS